MADGGVRAGVPLLAEIGEELQRLFRAEEDAAALRFAARADEQAAGLASGAGRGGRADVRRRSRAGAMARFNVRVVAVVVVLLLAATAVALAAGGLLRGSPVKPPYAPQPTKGTGVPSAAGVTLLGISAPDPGGGLPWGLELVKTTRGLGCLEFGRLSDGSLGVLGQDGAFGDDHRFHPLSALDAVSGLESCATLDAHGRLFLAAQMQAVPASAYPQACLPIVDEELGARAVGGLPSCPRADVRAVFYGVLGPDAKSISYSLATETVGVATRGRAGASKAVRTERYALHGPTVTVPTVGADGAYLIVAPALPGAASDTFGPDAPNGSSSLPYGSYQPIRAIAYSNGTVCRIGAKGDSDGKGGPCAPVGFKVLAGTASPTRVRSPIGVRVLYDHRDPPLAPEDVVRLSFAAHAAVTSAASRYVVEMRMPCRGASSGESTNEDVPVGKRLSFDLGLSIGPPGSKPCPGVYSGEVLYSTTRARVWSGASGLLVGRFSFRLP